MASTRSQRTALLVIGLLGAIAIGFALGVLTRFGFHDDPAPAPGPVDVGFAQDMSVHHNQAVEMAGMALIRSEDVAVKTLAYDILTTQQNQVGQMQGWLTLWDKPTLPTGQFMTWMKAEHGNHGSMPTGAVDKMPGMATPDDLAQLRQATGRDFDVRFLSLMLRHHQGGLAMAEYAATQAETDVVRRLADTVVKTQTSEAQLLTRMLGERGGKPLPMN